MDDDKTLRILIADDHPLFCEALSGIVNSVVEGAEIVCAADQAETLSCVEGDESFDLILLDLFLPGAEGFSCLKEVRSRAPETKLLIVSSLEDQGVISQSFDLGVSGFLSKSAPPHVMKEGLRQVLAGGTYVPDTLTSPLANRGWTGSPFSNSFDALELKKTLTPRQHAVLRLLSDGKANKQIAFELGISEITVKAHVSAILRKLKVSNRLQAAMIGQSLQQMGDAPT